MPKRTHVDVREMILRLFPNLEPAAQEALVQNSQLILNLRAGDNAISQLDSSVVCLLSGLVEVESPYRQQAIAYCGAGDIQGDEAALLRSTPPYNAKVRTDSCDVIVIKGEVFRAVWLKSPALQHNQSTRYRERAEAWERYDSDLLQASKPARLAIVLRAISQAVAHKKLVPWDDARFPFTPEWLKTKKDIEAVMCACGPTVRETLTRLAKLGAIYVGEDYGQNRLELPLIIREDAEDILTRMIENALL